MAVTPRVIVGVNDGSDPFTDQSTSTATNNNTPSTRLNAGLAKLETVNRVIVNQENVATTLGGVIDSNKEYFLDGVIDMGGASIIVPTTGMTMSGYSFDISGLTSSVDNHIMFKSESEAIGSGNLLGFDCFFQCTGTGAKVFELYDSNGFHAIEMNRVNFMNCTSLGDLHNYRQGLENGTGRFGGSPSLTLHGTWLGGFKIVTSITRSMSDTTTEPLFKAGTNFVMNSRFYTDMNVDLGSLQPLFDFSASNFPNASSLELVEALVTRDGARNVEDTNISPNILGSSLSSRWKGNIGVLNTFVGGMLRVTTEVATVITTQSVSTTLLGTFTANDLQHYTSPSNGKLRFDGTNPIEYAVNWDFILEGTANNDYKIELIRSDETVESVAYSQTRVINALQGGRDVAYFTGTTHLHLHDTDFLYWKISNLSGTGNATVELDSMWHIEER